ncbi:S66 peptidase family protein [Metabacillus herbersteinensis]|uniref:S66 peptidase family protein n=1 Tax=Metabacillus herbersteinensis TaxID=283816 RepID=A0ABV6GIJ3_9BACI
MIKYPLLTKGATIGVTAPSSGVPIELHDILKLAIKRMENKGHTVLCGDTVWTQNKAKSAPAKQRAEEFNKMMEDENVSILIPPWGGELLIEMLEYVNYETMKEKWILGYSDTSALLLAITLKTGLATANGTNLVDLRGEYSDPTTAKWQAVLSTHVGEKVIQTSSEKYQKEWQHTNPSSCIFHLTEQTYWRTASTKSVIVEGRLLGGCIDIIRHLIGTPYGDVRTFSKERLNQGPILWYFENCELSTTDLRRTLVQMKLAGWFENCSGVMFGRSNANQTVENYTIEDVYKELSNELQIPVIYDIDCGHLPPQITFVNGAYAEVIIEDGKGTVTQYFN